MQDLGQLEISLSVRTKDENQANFYFKKKGAFAPFFLFTLFKLFSFA